MTYQPTKEEFDLNCQRCPRLAGFLKQVRKDYPDYHGRPVSPYGSKAPKLLIVGLAPGMHGANATGRPFTGDYAGIILYETLYKFGFSNRPTSVSLDDGFKLKQCRITNAVKCLPPENKPIGQEVSLCNDYLKVEIGRLKAGTAILALGTVAHQAVLKACGLKQKAFAFGHNNKHALPNGLWLFDSYHCSRYNTSTKRLTPTMFEDVFKQIRCHIDR
ncbi:MAG: uracil-DNA glycosylase [Gammaproteobacteria bacterium]